MDHALSAMEQLQQSTSKLAIDAVARARNVSPTSDSLMERVGLDAASEGEQQPYHFHVYAHRHNCHITVTKPNRDAIISVSCGNLGFKKSQRKHYDSAYQLGAYVIDKLHQGGWHKKIKQMEVVLRGFGQGREAVTKVLLGTQGKMLRNSIVRVADATRLKFGGTRSPKPRRLG
jgi:small subunit ribosomal protein S11